MLIAQDLGYCEYSNQLKAQIMALTMSIRGYSATLKPNALTPQRSVPLTLG